ncbi:MAG: phosphoribosylanthranilate isomerase, partial [Verrucomicrobiia bacterium]
MWAKICGMTNLPDAQHAAACGADAVGFVLYPHSKRFLPPDQAASIARNLPPGVERVAVVVDLPEQELLHLAQSQSFDTFQLHGDESLELVHRLTASGLRLIKAIGCPPTPGLIDQWAQNPEPDRFLLDKASPAHGGTGEPVDWDLAARWVPALRRPVIL